MSRKRPLPKDHEIDESPSLNLWIGDLSSETIDSDLMAIFKDYGALDAFTSYFPRTYAFVFFKKEEDAKKARDELQGSVIKGRVIKIQIARPAKPGKYIWIGGIGSSVTKEQLEDELLRFGKIEEYKFLRDRNSALVTYCKLDDAIAAQKSLNGKNLGGEQVRADFQKPHIQKPQSSQKDWPDNRSSRGNRRNTGPQEGWIAADELQSHQEFPNQGSKRNLPHGGRRDGPPSNTLWVGYPPSVRMDEEMLHNAMILFGEIENIKSFPSRHYSFVEFRSVDEARRAKEGLQGRLFGDPRIQILFSSSEFANGKETAPLLPGYRVSRPDMLFNESPLVPMEFFGPSHPIRQNAFPEHFLDNRQGQHSAQGFDPHEGGLDYHDFSGQVPAFHDGKPNVPHWRQLSPASMHSPSLGMRPPPRPVPSVWEDGFDMKEPKKSRIDGSPVNDAHFLGRRGGDDSIRRQYGSPKIDHFWRGVIAKGGLPVCRARCVQLGRGLESPLPEVVNCFARTDLDMLTKHYAEAIGFDVVFFLPDSENDFASYTEFLQYLGLKNRVGVAKCDDGTTLFLVPPSDFLKKVLKVSGPERLYGVVLKLSHKSTPEVQLPQAAPLPPPRYGEERNEPISQERYEDQSLRMDYGASLLDNSISHARVEHPSQTYSMPSAPHDSMRNPDAKSQVEVSLTPELIATLASLIPSTSQSSTTGNNNMPLSSSMTSSFPINASHVTSIPPPSQGWIQERQSTFFASQLEPRNNTLQPAQGWIQERQSTFSTSQLDPRSNMPQQLQHFGGDYNIEAPFMSQYPSYANLPPNGSENSVQGPDLAPNMPQVSATPTRQFDNYAPSHGQSLVSSHQHYQYDSSFNSDNASGSLQQSAPANSSMQGQTANMLQNQTGPNADYSASMQQLQLPVNGSGDDTSRGDVEKNQRYQSTLQLAASLLQKIQQQGSGHAAGGSVN